MPTRAATNAEIERVTPLRTSFLFNLSIGQAIEVSGNTHWEELGCVGYNPHSSKLEAVVTIKRSSGYSGGLCSLGSPEFVSFWVDWGTGFEHVGLVSFKAHDIPDSPAQQHPLEYSVELDLPTGDHRRRCRTAVLPLVRAVLSWNVPPSLDPNLLPVFGNRVDTHIQLEPRYSFVAAEIDKFSAAASVVQSASTKPTLSLVELAESYKEAQVPGHRFLMPALAPLVLGTAPTSQLLSTEASALLELGVNLQAAANAVAEVSADTSFEELTCVGLASDFDSLAGIIHLKRAQGYSGDLCHAGSNEYVAFWADWDNDGTFEEYLGTAHVAVHDLGAAFPSRGLSYSVTLFSPSFARHVRECTRPTVVRIRGVLSWSSPPSTTDPHPLNVWGNRVDVLVQLRTGRGGDGLIDAIYRVGGVALPDISPTTHLAFPSSTLSTSCGQPAQDRPWADLVSVQGRLYNTGPAGSVRYRVRYKPHLLPDLDTNWTPAMLSQHYTTIVPPTTFIPIDEMAVSEPGLGGGWFDYVENPSVSPPIYEIDARLADWYTGALEGVYDLRLEYRRVTDPAGFFLRSSTVTITLHNHNLVTDIVPTAALNSALDVDIVILGGDCHSYPQGTSFTGQVRVVDPYFWGWSLQIQPAAHVLSPAALNPHCRVYTSIADGGDTAATYTINTGHLEKCGYALILVGTDRAIRSNNGAVTHSASKAVGFSVH